MLTAASMDGNPAAWLRVTQCIHTWVTWSDSCQHLYEEALLASGSTPGHICFSAPGKGTPYRWESHRPQMEVCTTLNSILVHSEMCGLQIPLLAERSLESCMGTGTTVILR